MIEKLDKIQKILANAGVASRRQIEQWIKDNRIKVNNKPAELGQRISIKDKILIDNKLFKFPDFIKNPESIEHELIIYNKPVGEICSRSDPKHENTVFKNLPKPKVGRWIQVGRLDINTSGLLLFTTDGQLANKLMHPKSQIERVYLVRVFGNVTDDKINKLSSKVKLEDGFSSFKSIKKVNFNKPDAKKDIKKDHKNQWFECSLMRGKNREVRRLWESQDCSVSRLIRIRFAEYSLPKDLKPGKYRKI